MGILRAALGIAIGLAVTAPAANAASGPPLVQGAPSLARDLVLCRDADSATELAAAMHGGTAIDNPVARGAVWRAVVQGECAGFETLLGFTPLRPVAEASGFFVIEAQFIMADGPATYFMVTRRSFRPAPPAPLPETSGAVPQAATLPQESTEVPTP